MKYWPSAKAADASIVKASPVNVGSGNRGSMRGRDCQSSAATGSINPGSLCLTLPTRLSTGHSAIRSAG
jgi:hypothetical protein